jgi:hypothetical protein
VRTEVAGFTEEDEPEGVDRGLEALLPMSFFLE